MSSEEFIEFLEREAIDHGDIFGSLMDIAFQFAEYCLYDREYTDPIAAMRVEDLIYSELGYRSAMFGPEDAGYIRAEMLPMVESDMELWHIGMYLNDGLDAIPEDKKY